MGWGRKPVLVCGCCLFIYFFVLLFIENMVWSRCTARQRNPWILWLLKPFRALRSVQFTARKFYFNKESDSFVILMGHWQANAIGGLWVKEKSIPGGSIYLWKHVFCGFTIKATLLGYDAPEKSSGKLLSRVFPVTM